MHPVPPNLQLPGVAGPAEQQVRYFQLMKQGWNNNDACRAVGICRKTGTRWRVGRTETKNGKTHSYPAVEPVNTTGISKRFLSEQERVRIADLHRVGKNTTSIAAELGRAVDHRPELQRNLGPAGGRYLHTPRNGSRQPAGGNPKRPGSPPTRCYRIRRRAPGQTAQPGADRATHLRRFPNSPAHQLAMETLYQAVYQPGRNGLTSAARRVCAAAGDVVDRWLRRRRPGHLLPDVIIDARPEEANDQVQPGHLEGDVIIGRNGGTAIGTLVERTTGS